MFLFLEEKRKEKQKLRVKKMAMRPKRKYQTTSEQNALLVESTENWMKKMSCSLVIDL